MHKKKTGALIEAGSKFGRLYYRRVKENEEFNKISQFSSNLGLAFQIKDDILNVTGDEDILGKPIGSDKEWKKYICYFARLRKSRRHSETPY